MWAMMTHDYNSLPWEAKVRGSQIQYHPELKSDILASKQDQIKIIVYESTLLWKHFSFVYSLYLKNSSTTIIS